VLKKSGGRSAALGEKDARAALLPRARLLARSLRSRSGSERRKMTNFSTESFVHRFTAVLVVAADSDPCADPTPARKQVSFQAHSPSDLPSHVIFGVAFRNEQSQYIAITQKTENHTQKYDSTAGAALGELRSNFRTKKLQTPTTTMFHGYFKRASEIIRTNGVLHSLPSALTSRPRPQGASRPA